MQKIILPTKHLGGDVRRATKGAAKSILGKVYLTTHDFVNAETKLRKSLPWVMHFAQNTLTYLTIQKTNTTANNI